MITFFHHRCQLNRKKEVKCPGTAYLDVYKKEIDFKVTHCHEPVHNDTNFTVTSEIIDRNNQNIGDNFETFNSNSATDSNLVINQNVGDNLEIDAVKGKALDFENLISKVYKCVYCPKRF